MDFDNTEKNGDKEGSYPLNTENKKRRANRNIKVIITDELPEGVTEEEYRIIEESMDRDND